jgi:hypothetical protein
MTLEKLGAGIDFVQDATPPASDASDGDVYLDTSLSPPEVKVFDASVGSFVRPKTAQNLDKQVSNSGVNWESKTADVEVVQGGTVSVSGSGYLMTVARGGSGGGTSIAPDIDIDGTRIFGGSSFTTALLFARFDSGFSVSSTRGKRIIVSFVLD